MMILLAKQKAKPDETLRIYAHGSYPSVSIRYED